MYVFLDFRSIELHHMLVYNGENIEGNFTALAQKSLHVEEKLRPRLQTVPAFFLLLSIQRYNNSPCEVSHCQMHKERYYSLIQLIIRVRDLPVVA